MTEADQCLAHASSDLRRGFLEVVACEEQGLSGYLSHLELDQALLDDLLPAIEALREEPVGFNGAVFSGDVDFRTRALRVPVSFVGCRFVGGVSFERVTFESSVSFAAAVFSASATFGTEVARAVESGSLTFCTATFVDDADFTGAEFVGDALFEGVKLGGSLWLDRTSFHRECRFVLQDYELPERQEWRRVPDVERTNSLRDTRFRDGAILSLPGGSVESEDMEFGDAMRIEISGSIVLDSISSPYPLIILQRDGGSEGARSAEIRSLSRSVVQAPLIVGDGVGLQHCTFEGTRGLEWLRMPSEMPMQRYGQRLVLAEELHWREARSSRQQLLRAALFRRSNHHSTGRVSGTNVAGPEKMPDPLAIASTYRQLRQGLEDAKNAPGAADLYYGEMEMRRSGSKRHAEKVILWLYWVLSGYGLRVWRSLTWLLGVVVVTALGVRSLPAIFQEPCAPDEACPDIGNLWAATNFVVRWAISFQPPPDISGISTAGESLLIGVRIVTPILIALTVLALRSRVHR